MHISISTRFSLITFFLSEIPCNTFLMKCELLLLRRLMFEMVRRAGRIWQDNKCSIFGIWEVFSVILFNSSVCQHLWKSLTARNLNTLDGFHRNVMGSDGCKRRGGCSGGPFQHKFINEYNRIIHWQWETEFPLAFLLPYLLSCQLWRYILLGNIYTLLKGSINLLVAFARTYLRKATLQWQITLILPFYSSLNTISRSKWGLPWLILNCKIL